MSHLSRLGARELQISLKYTIDRLLAAVGLVLLSPVMAVIALLVRASDGGPAIFVHDRIGLGMSEVSVYKFRTMIVDADDFLDSEGRPTRDRSTRIGKILRTTSLDELPQLVNILRGEMSFIGPRPMVRDHLPRLNPEHLVRFRMRPGISGLAQIEGRSRLPWTERLEYDRRYVAHYSLRLDAQIAFRTLAVLFRRDLVASDRNPGEVMDLPDP